MSYATIAELKARIDKTSAGDDAVLTAVIAAAELNINDTCNRPDGFEADAVASARIYAGSGKSYQYIDDCVEITAVAVKDSITDTTYTAWTATDYIKCSGDPVEPNFNRLPYTMLIVDPAGDYSIFTNGRYSNIPGFSPDQDTKTTTRGAPTVQITAKWGYSVAVPYTIKEACLMQAARWYKRFEGAMSDALASGELGMLLYRQSLDPDIKRLLVDGRYIRPAVG